MEGLIFKAITAGGDLATIGLFVLFLNLRGRIIKMETIIELLLKGQLKNGKDET